MNKRPYPWITLYGSHLSPVTLVWSPRRNAFVCQHHKWGRMEIRGRFQVTYNHGVYVNGRTVYLAALDLREQTRTFEVEPMRPAWWMITSFVAWHGHPSSRVFPAYVAPLQRADITDRMVCETVAEFQSDDWRRGQIITRLVEKTGCHYKVALRALERAESRGLIDYGVSIAYPWLTDKGKALLCDA